MRGSPRGARRRLTAKERHEQLMLVGRDVFSERGYAGTAIEEIAARAGVSKPLIYQHFGGKDGLYAEIVDREVHSLIHRITSALRTTDPRTALEQAADAFLGYIEDEAPGFRVLIRDAPSGTEGGSLSAVLAEIATAVQRLLAKELRARGYARSVAPVVARALVGMVALTGEWWLEVRRPGRRAVATHLVNLAWNGLRGLEKDARAPGEPNAANLRAGAAAEAIPAGP